MSFPISALPPSAVPASDARVATKEQAQQLEATFLSMMMGYAGVGEVKGSFGGGEGEAQFASFLRDAYAQSTVDAGGIGLAETIFNAMMKGQENGSGK